MSDKLDTCGCCEGVEALTPASVENRPGLSALAYRVGTHARFKQAMQAALAGALPALTTRADDDPAIALFDAWATVLDVLSFYQERIANEGYLRTAAERQSVLALARSIGYELRPGVAAGTFLAFKLETAPGAPTSAVIDVGTKAQSLPGQDEVPQVFETVEKIEAQAAWNAMKARQHRPYVPGMNARTIYLKGTSTNLKPGDALLLVGEERERNPGNENWDFRLVKALEEDREAELTIVELNRGLGSFTPFTRPAADPEVYALRRRAALFGHNAPDWRAMPDSVKDGYETLGPNDTHGPNWPGFTIREIADNQADTVYLDAVYPKIVPDSWIVLATPDYSEVYRVDRVAEDARTNFTLSSKTTRLRVDGENLLERFDQRIRDTVVFAESEWLEQDERPIEGAVEGDTVELAEAVEGLVEDQLVVVAGLDDDTGEAVSEVMTLKKAEPYDGVTRLTFTERLVYRYRRESVEINANVARATHGETQKDEVLGSGDGSRRFQRFTLKKKPLTYVSAATASGAESTLDVRVGGVLWEEVPSLYQLGAGRRAYLTRLADDGTVTVQFGDGINGARLPTGTENVTARYRVGLGLDGMTMVDAGQISLLMTRPLGVKSVVNPLAPTGAADLETLDEARENAPLTVLTLDRIVSLQDFEDFTRAFAGIGKAQATLLWNGERRLIHLTVAGADGSAVPEESDLYDNLRDAIDAARHVDEQVELDTYAALTFTLEARVLVDAAYVAEDVLAAVREALVAAFSFEARAFGQTVTASEVLAVAQQAHPGVVAVDLERLDGRDPFAFPRLPAGIARWESGVILPAQLLTVDPDGITLSEMTP